MTGLLVVTLTSLVAIAASVLSVQWVRPHERGLTLVAAVAAVAIVATTIVAVVGEVTR